MRKTKLLFATFILLAVAGCASGVKFPSAPLSNTDTPQGKQAAYDTNGDGKADYFTYADNSGRITVIAYDYANKGAPDSFVNLDEQPNSRCRHLFIILDGVAFDVVKEFYDAGHLRMFYPPSRLVAPFPAMTDLAVEDALGDIPCPALEASYYDRVTGAAAGGQWNYLLQKNAPASRLITYRQWVPLDALAYFSPWLIFKHEIHGAKSALDRHDTQDVIFYSAGCAGMGTGNGKEGHVRCLELTERMINQVTLETRGMVKFTIIADHGHTYTKPARLDLPGLLRKKGWHPGNHLDAPKDFVMPEFGDVTYAAFYTHDAAALAADLAAIEGVELAVYQADGKISLVSRRGNALISERNGRYKYEPQGGDVLQLNDIVAKLRAEGKVDDSGFIDDRALLEATAAHLYPDPLRRLWRAFNGMVENVPDVIVSIEDNYYAGSANYAFLVKLNSTHGGLNYKNSLAFAMSTAGPLPPVMRSEDIPKNLGAVLGRPFPPCKSGKP
jgi:hypothetical protein